MNRIPSSPHASPDSKSVSKEARAALIVSTIAKSILSASLGMDGGGTGVGRNFSAAKAIAPTSTMQPIAAIRTAFDVGAEVSLVVDFDGDAVLRLRLIVSPRRFEKVGLR